METLLDAVPCPVIAWSRDRSSFVPNQSARELFGLSGEQSVETPSLWLNRIRPADSSHRSAAWAELQSGGKKVTCEFRFSVYGSDKEIWLREVSCPNPADENKSVISTYTDISDLKAGSLMLDRDEELKRVADFIESRIHQITNYLQILSLELALDSEQTPTPPDFTLLFNCVGSIVKTMEDVREKFNPASANPARSDRREPPSDENSR